MVVVNRQLSRALHGGLNQVLVHGKLVQAEEIFDAKDNYTIYFVSDNTGDTNGGSDKLVEKYKRGHVIYNTINGDQACEGSTFRVTTSVGSYLWGRD